MQSLIAYLIQCIQPKNENEFVETDIFDAKLFENLVQDGFLVCKSFPTGFQKRTDMEVMQLADIFIVKKAIRDIAWLLDNDQNVIQFDTSKEPIYRRLDPYPPETVDHVFIMMCIIEKINIKFNYLEYGVSLGHSLKRIAELANVAYGVDIEKRANSLPPNVIFYEMKTDEFSLNVLPTIIFSVAFIDADHSFKSAYTDFCNIFKYIQPGGYIFLHDTYPCLQEYLKPHLCNDCYKTVIQIKKDFPDLQILNFPLNPGLAIVRKPVYSDDLKPVAI
jgi:hypothetical protein